MLLLGFGTNFINAIAADAAGYGFRRYLRPKNWDQHAIYLPRYRANYGICEYLLGLGITEAKKHL